MNYEVETAIITAGVSIITAVVGYIKGRKKTDAEATNAAFEGYNLALESLRKNFENQLQDLRNRITDLTAENESLKQKIDKLENDK